MRRRQPPAATARPPAPSRCATWRRPSPTPTPTRPHRSVYDQERGGRSARCVRAGTHHSRAEARAPATPLLTPGTRCRGGWGGGRGKGVRGEGGHPSHARPPGDGGANHPPPQPLTPPSLPCQLQQHRVCTLKHKCSNNRCKWSENCCPILPRASRHRARCRALPGGGCWVGPSLCCAAPPLACAALARRRPRMLCPFPLGFSPLHCTVDPCCICICACLPPLLMPLDWSQLPRGGREEGGGGHLCARGDRCTCPNKHLAG